MDGHDTIIVQSPSNFIYDPNFWWLGVCVCVWGGGGGHDHLHLKKVTYQLCCFPLFPSLVKCEKLRPYITIMIMVIKNKSKWKM